MYICIRGKSFAPVSTILPLDIAAIPSNRLMFSETCTLWKQPLSDRYLTCIRTTLEYGCEDWDGCFEREIAKLEKSSYIIFNDEMNDLLSAMCSSLSQLVFQ
jgi:hypothetical protein